MNDFPLLDLNDANMEKVVNKIKVRDYIALQQTCREVYEFIRNCRNISIPLDEKCSVCYRKKGKRVVFYTENCYYPLSAVKLYGLRLATLSTPEDIYGFEYFFPALKDNRVTCEELDLIGSIKWTMEACLAMMKIVKPTKVKINSVDHDRYESVFLYKPLKSIKIHLDMETAIQIVKKLLDSFPEIKMQLPNNSDYFHLIRIILKILCFKTPSNLRDFRFQTKFDNQDLPSKEVIIARLEGISLTGEPTDNSFLVNLPPELGATCKLSFESSWRDTSVQLTYQITNSSS